MSTTGGTGAADRAALLEVLSERGHLRLDEPVTLASGATSRDFLDVKRALADGADLARACRSLLALAEQRTGARPELVGGMTMGADQFSYGCAVLAGTRWFVVRKQAKDRGTAKRIEGAALGPGDRALLVEDVVTTGGSLLEACRVVADTGATVTLATAVVDRGDVATERFAAEGFELATLFTYRDLDMDPVVPPTG